jgi:hypothetical protein
MIFTGKCLWTLEGPMAATSSAAMQDLPRSPKAYPFQGILIHLMVRKDLDAIPADVDPEDPQNQVAHGGVLCW